MQIKDLVVTGDARILGNLYTKDGSVGTGGGGGDGGSGVTYRLTKSGSTITLTGSDGSTSSVTDTDTNTTYTLSSLGAAPVSHDHIEIVNGTVGVRASDSNEISFKSNVNYIYFGYENRAGSSGIIDTYKFGTHSGVNNATKGIIECGRVVEDGTALSSKYSPISHSHSNYAASSHTHDDRYYTESEVNSLLNNKANSSHTQAASTITTGIFPGYVAANASYQTYSTSLLRNSKLVSSATDPSANGEIYWTYE